MHPVSALLTDYYQLTMACAYLRAGMQSTNAVFQLFFRTAPFGSSFAIACGIHDAARIIRDFHFNAEELAFLRSLKGPDLQPQFDNSFLDYLKHLKLEVEIDAVSEGSLVFAHEPILRIRGPIIHCQLLETALLNTINFQTLIATKAARLRFAAKNDEVIEFGLRRAQGFDGGLSASRAAYIGGCDSTSNVLAAMRFDIPAKGTLAHSFVMAFDAEIDAFEAYASALPQNSLLLVDTYDTLRGVENAIKIGKGLEKRGHQLLGVRLDSGDLATLSKQSRRMLDAAGFQRAVIVASGDLDEYSIEQLKSQGAPINIWGIGTKLVTAFDEPALGGVYKLSSVEGSDHLRHNRLKFSNDPHKATLPGQLQVKRFLRKGVPCGDVIFNQQAGISPNSIKHFPSECESHDILTPLFQNGVLTRQLPSLAQIKQQLYRDVEHLPKQYQHLRSPAPYPIHIDDFVQNEANQMRRNYESSDRR